MNFMQTRDEGFGEDAGFVPSRVNQNKVYEPQVSSSWSYGPAVVASISEHEDEAEKLDPMETSPRNVGVEPTWDVPLVEIEHMFDKVVTPSDVGKLNRLVIPKQNAEKYFPLNLSTNEKGLLLNFEDRQGKPWRFRYSYWNSSQSYVMTKGWSSFVKEKKLDAGDIVSFQRGVSEAGKDRLFIDWRRRPNISDPPSFPGNFPVLPGHFAFHRTAAVPWSPLILHPGGSRDHLQLNSVNYGSYCHRYGDRGGGSCSEGGDACRYGYGSIVNLNHCGIRLNSVYYIVPQQMGAIGSGNSGLGACNSGGNYERVVLNSVPVVQGKAPAKRLRLFGVNMECPLSESDEQDVALSSTSSISHVQNQHPQHDNAQHQQHSLSSSNSFSGFHHPLSQPEMSMPAADFSNEGNTRGSSASALEEEEAAGFGVIRWINASPQFL